MRTALLLCLLLSACIQPDPAHYGTQTVAPNGCSDPQTSYVDEVTNLNQLGLAAWRRQTDLSQPITAEIFCNDFTSDCADFHIASACGSQAGYFDLGTHAVHIDRARANGLFAFSGVQNHELIHLYINGGPHPERAQMHICECGTIAAECWPGGCGRRNLMSPVLAGLGTSTMTSWNGMVESADVGEITQNSPTALDRQFVTWAISP